MLHDEVERVDAVTGVVGKDGRGGVHHDGADAEQCGHADDHLKARVRTLLERRDGAPLRLPVLLLLFPSEAQHACSSAAIARAQAMNRALRSA